MKFEDLLEKARKLGVSPNTYKFLRRSNRKMRYFAHDLKRERIIIENETITFIPSREDSLERLMEDEGLFFSMAEPSVEDIVIGKAMIEQLYHALNQLEPDERQLIDEIYFSLDGEIKSEREAAKSLGMPQKTLNERKLRIVEKLRFLMGIEK